MSEIEKLFGKPLKEITNTELQYALDLPYNVPFGYCFCGCGQKTQISKQNCDTNNYVRGLPLRWIKNHDKVNSGKGWYKHSAGYIMVMVKGHPRASKGFVMEHIVVMEKFIGRYLNIGESVHHIDGDRGNNNLSNLMLFSSEAEHQEYERRYRSYVACGHWDWVKCVYCHNFNKLDSNMIRQGSGWSHRSCRKIYDKQRKSGAIDRVGNLRRMVNDAA